jgi:hypothetical protein
MTQHSIRGSDPIDAIFGSGNGLGGINRGIGETMADSHGTNFDTIFSLSTP